MYKEVLSSRIKVTDDTTISRLSLVDQIKLLIAQISHPEVEKLRGQATVLKKRALSRASVHKTFIEICNELSKSDENYVIFKLRSSYLPYLEEFTNAQTGYGKMFDFIVTDREEDPSLNYVVYVKIKKKEVSE